MTGISEFKLKAYRLTGSQWCLAEDFEEVLWVNFKFISPEIVINLTNLYSSSKNLQNSSQKPIPLLALPMLYTLRDSLKAVVLDTPPLRDDESDADEDMLPEGSIHFSDSSSDSGIWAPSRPTPAVIRIAAQASIYVIDKYMDLIWDCDIYVIAIGGVFLI